IVANAWAGFGAAFGPVLVLALHWRGMNRNGAVAAIITGAATVIIWISADAFGTGLYEMIPGVILSTIAGIVVSKLSTPSAEVTEAMTTELDRKSTRLNSS